MIFEAEQRPKSSPKSDGEKRGASCSVGQSGEGESRSAAVLTTESANETIPKKIKGPPRANVMSLTNRPARTGFKGVTMIELQRNRFSKAIEKAKAVKNFVRMIRFQQYEVMTPKLDAYVVTIWTNNGRRVAACTCQAGKKNLPCYHIASAAALHLAVEPPQPTAAAYLPNAKAQPPSLGGMLGF